MLSNWFLQKGLFCTVWLENKGRLKTNILLAILSQYRTFSFGYEIIQMTYLGTLEKVIILNDASSSIWSI